MQVPSALGAGQEEAPGPRCSKFAGRFDRAAVDVGVVLDELGDGNGAPLVGNALAGVARLRHSESAY
jgi:hypothetical protein